MKDKLFHDDAQLGITFELDPDVAQALRNGRPRQQEQPREEIDDDWQLIMAHSQTESSSTSPASNDDAETAETTPLDDVPPERKPLVVDDEDDLSSTEPPSLPLLLVDAERLTGYLPESVEQHASMSRTLRLALYGHVENEQEELFVPDESSPTVLKHFFREVEQILSCGMARHGETSGNDAINMRLLKVPYPSYILSHHHNGGETDCPLKKTALVWKRLLQPHPIPVVDRLLTRLRDCSRLLSWKEALCLEIRQLVKAEQAAKEQVEYALECQVWRLAKRGKQLEKLYTVREAFQERLTTAQEGLKALEQDREQKVASRLRHERLKQNGAGGLEAFDFESTVFSFPEGDGPIENLLMAKEEDDWDEEYPVVVSESELGGDVESGSDSDNETADYDGDAEDHQDELKCEEEGLPETAETSILSSDSIEPSLDVQGSSDAALANDDGEEEVEPAVFPHEKQKKSKDRRRAAARKRQQERRRLEEEAHKVKLEEAHAQESAMREACTSSDLLMAMAICQSLERKLSQVDELLESLQEEEWADEEEGVENIVQEVELPPRESRSEWTLLDQILAMILGATPPPVVEDNKSDTVLIQQQHVKDLEAEHQAIVADWLEFFGRLPPAVPSTREPSIDTVGATAKRRDLESHGSDSRPPLEDPFDPSQKQAMRSALGIIDNESHDWEESS